MRTKEKAIVVKKYIKHLKEEERDVIFDDVLSSNTKITYELVLETDTYKDFNIEVDKETFDSVIVGSKGIASYTKILGILFNLHFEKE